LGWCLVVLPPEPHNAFPAGMRNGCTGLGWVGYAPSRRWSPPPGPARVSGLSPCLPWILDRHRPVGRPGLRSLRLSSSVYNAAASSRLGMCRRGPCDPACAVPCHPAHLASASWHLLTVTGMDFARQGPCARMLHRKNPNLNPIILSLSSLPDKFRTSDGRSRIGFERFPSIRLFFIMYSTAGNTRRTILTTEKAEKVRERNAG
jgi:hypothetical protein